MFKAWGCFVVLGLMLFGPVVLALAFTDEPEPPTEIVEVWPAAASVCGTPYRPEARTEKLHVKMGQRNVS
jgi:hypothetical protein